MHQPSADFVISSLFPSTAAENSPATRWGCDQDSSGVAGCVPLAEFQCCLFYSPVRCGYHYPCITDEAAEGQRT